MSYYDNHADAFISETLDIDMTSIYLPFLNCFHGQTLLDLGCGPGRDLKYFASQGLTVTGLEPSSVLAQFARQYSGADIIEQRIQDLNIDRVFDGIWACASLLHVPTLELPSTFTTIAKHLNHNGIIYCSFKYGDFEGMRNGRFFTDRTEASLQSVLPDNLHIHHSWLTHDKRPGREEQWLNTLLLKR